MGFFGSFGCLVLCTAFAAASRSQAPRVRPNDPPRLTVDQAVMAMPWDAAKDGPMVAVCAPRVASGPTLDDLGLKRATVGGLTALVPVTMTTINSRFTNSPNMYEGMPQEAKVMYLLRSLTPGQWRIAAGEGLTIGDLQGEQRLVFDSILPNPLRYSMGTIVNGNGITNPSSDKEIRTVEGAERAKVKLRVIRHLEVQVALENDGGYTGTTIEEDTKDGMQMPYILPEEDAEFGQKIIVTSPNAPKKSQLDLGDSRLAAPIPLVTPRETVEALLARVATATGLRLVCDPHYRYETVVERGTNVPARDLLGALTLGVGGTFRRVGGTYVLTNDLEGIAAHQARIAAWEDALKKIVEEREGQWRYDIATGGNFGKIAFHSAAFDGLTPEEQANLEANDKPRNGPAYIPLSQASKPFQDAIKNWKYGNKIDREKVGVSSSIRYEIVLPGVGRGWWQGWLGNGEQFGTKPYVWTAKEPKPVALPFAPTQALSALMLHAGTSIEAQHQVDRAAKLGVGEVWLEATDPKALAAGVAEGKKLGVKVALALRPWNVLPGEEAAEPDRNAAGAHGARLFDDLASLEPWRRFWIDEAAFAPAIPETIAPLDPAVARHVARAAELAKVPGLSRVALLDLYLPGYAKDSSRYGSGYYYSDAIDNYRLLGFTDAQRAAFLAEKNVDPLDIENDTARTQVRFETAWGGMYSGGENFESWQKARGKWAHEAALKVGRAVADPSRPVLLEGQPAEIHQQPLGGDFLLFWNGTAELPVAAHDFGMGDTIKNCDVAVVEIQDEHDPVLRNRVASRIGKFLEGGKPVVLDFSSVPSSKIDIVLARWLKKG